MKPIPKFLVRAGVGVAAVAVLAVLAVNLYIQSAPVRERMEAALGRSLGYPVTVARMSYTPWGGLRLKGVASRDPRGGTTIDAPGFRVRFQSLPLLARKVVVREILIENPRVTVAQLPPPPPPDHPAPDATPEPSPPEPGSGTVAEATPGAATPAAEAPAGAGPWQVEIRAINLQEGSFLYKDEAGRPLVLLEGIRIHSLVGDGAAGTTGEAEVAKATILGRWQLAALRSPFVYRHASRRLEFSQIAAQVAAGVLDGAFMLDASAAKPRFSTQVKFRDVEVSQLLAQAGLEADRVSGRMEGRAELAGMAGDSSKLQGSGEAFLKGGQMKQIELLRTLGEALRIEELVNFEMKDASLKFIVKKGTVQVNELLLQSANLRLRTAGKIKPAGKLDLDARLYLNRKIRTRLPSLAKANMVPDPSDPDTSYLDFEITGTLEHPRSNILDRLVGEKLQREVGKVLKGFFGGDGGNKDAPPDGE